MRNVDKIKELEYELGRYKKAVVTRDTVIGQLREEIAGQYEVAKILSAYMSIFVEGEGGRTIISKERVAERIGKKRISCSEDGDSYIIEVK